MSDSLHQIVREAEKNLVSGTTKLGEHVDWSMHDTIETIFAYLNSRHTSGPQDALGRDKPFFNIVTAAVNIWYRATDLDRKDIVIQPDKSSNIVPAFIATVLLQNWMKKTYFNQFLNQWGRTLSQYGSAVVKFIEKEGELVATVVPWNRIITDPINFYALPRIEKFYKTPAQLKNMATKGHPEYAGYNLQAVNSLIESQTTRRNLRDEQVDNQDNFIELYEIHGELSLANYKEGKGENIKDGDEEIYFQQMHVLSWVETKDGNKDFTVYSGKEKRDPYMITHLIEEEGRTLSIGAVEYLFDAQWMQNHTVKQWKDQMDLSSRLVFQTADTKFLGKNVLTNLETGDIMIHELNKPIEMFPNGGHDFNNLKAFSDQWKVLTQEITSTPDAARGNTMPSNTPYSLGAYLGTQALSLFEIMTENKANHLEVMLREFIIPHLKTKLNTTDEVAAMLEDRDIKRLDSMYVPREAVKRFNQKIKQSLLAGELPEDVDLNQEISDVQQQLGALGNQRFLSPGDVSWKDALKDLEWEVEVGITNEQADKQTVYTTLASVLQTIATNPTVLQDPNVRLVFNKILGQTNVVSPVELSATSTPSPMAGAPMGPSPLQALTTVK